MNLLIPTVKIDAEMKAPTNSAQIQSVHSNYDETILATKTMSGILAAVDDFNVAYDATIASEARREISTLNATEFADFQVNNNNPKDGDLEKAVETLNTKQQKILDKYGIDDLDSRVRTRFDENISNDNARFASNVAASMIEKQYKARMRLHESEIAYNINEAQMSYNNPDAIAKSTALAMEALEAKGKMEGWTDEEFKYQRLKLHSAVQLTVGWTAAKKGDYSIVKRIVDTQHTNMIDDDWRKLAGLWKSYQSDMALKSSKIDPVLSYSLAVKKKMSVYTDDYIQSEADANGFTFDQMKMVLETRVSDEVMAEIKQRNLESELSYQPIAKASRLIESFKNHPSVQRAVTLNDKLIAVFGLVNGIQDLAEQENPDRTNQAVNAAMKAYDNVVSYKGYAKLLEEVAYGNKVLDNDPVQAELYKKFEKDIDAFAGMTNEQFVAKFRGEMGASLGTLNKAKARLDAYRSEKLIVADKQNADSLLNFYLNSNSTGTFKHSVGNYSLIIPTELQKAMDKKAVSKSKVNNRANQLFKNGLFSLMMQKTGSDNLAAAIHSLERGSDLIMDKDGNLLPEVVELVNQTKKQVGLEFGHLVKDAEPKQLKPSEMPYQWQQFYNYGQIAY